jgi:prohibitin 1
MAVLCPAGRKAVAGFTAQEAYATKREELSVSIQQRFESHLKDAVTKTQGYTSDPFVIQQVLVRNIILPQELKKSVEAKLQAEQDALAMEYVLQQARQEAERKRIEAKGIADFQAIVTQGISDKLLAWKGIEATEALAKSPNAKVVVVGSGKNGLPIILGQ